MILIKSSQLATTKTGSPYLKISGILHKEGEFQNITLNVWGTSKTLPPFSVAKVDIKNLKEFQGQYSCQISDIQLEDLNDDTALIFHKYIPVLVTKEQWNTLVSQVSSQFKYPELEAIFKTSSEKVFDLYSNYPAGKSLHQPYKGGLLLHTYQMLNLLLGIFSHSPYPFVFDHVALAILFHDFGKVQEYKEQDQNFVTTEQYALMGHIYISAHFVNNLLVQAKVAECHILSIVHCILAHHSKKEWGSPVVPATIEAFITHHIDMLSGIGDIYDKTPHMESSWALGTSVIDTLTLMKDVVDYDPS